MRLAYVTGAYHPQMPPVSDGKFTNYLIMFDTHRDTPHHFHFLRGIGTHGVVRLYVVSKVGHFGTSDKDSSSTKSLLPGLDNYAIIMEKR